MSIQNVKHIFDVLIGSQFEAPIKSGVHLKPIGRFQGRALLMRRNLVNNATERM